MPAPSDPPPAADPAAPPALAAAAEMPLLLEQETEVSLLAAGDPLFASFTPDDFKAYVRFRICTAFPNIIGPESHGRYFGFHPQVLALSFESLLHQQTNLGHMLKAYGAYRDRIQGGIVAVSVARGGKPVRGGGALSIPESVADAPYLDVIAVLWKIAEGNKELLGRHMSARQKSSVSIEVASTVSDLDVYDPRDRSIVPMAVAREQWPDLITVHRKNGIQIGGIDGTQMAFAAGGEDRAVPFRGVGYTPNPAERRTAKIVDLSASGGDDAAIAAVLSYDWEPGMDVSWMPVLHGRDAGRGTVREIVMEGSRTLHGRTMEASPEDPLLVVKVHGKRLEVIRHSSSVKKI